MVRYVGSLPLLHESELTQWETMSHLHIWKKVLIEVIKMQDQLETRMEDETNKKFDRKSG